MSVTENTKTESTRRGLLLIDAQEVARRLGRSERTVWRITAAEKLPNPIAIGDQSKRWRAEDIRSWVAAGCPHRSHWEALRLRKPDGTSGSGVSRVVVDYDSRLNPNLV